MIGVYLVGIDETRSRLVQEGRTIGQVFIHAPSWAQGAEVFAEAPSSPFNAPVTGVTAGLLRVHFRAGSASGEYVVAFDLARGNRLHMFVRAD